MARLGESVDMLHGPLLKKIILFAIPIALSGIIQQLFNSADTAIVGKFVDSNALAAVGTNVEIIAMIVAFSTGLSIGTNVLIAKYIGSGRTEKINSAIHSSILLAVVFGIIIMIIGLFTARPLLIAIKTPDVILDLAVTYLRIYYIGYPFLLLYDFGSAILRSKGDTKRPFIALTFSGVLNVGLNLFFVLAFKLGVFGVAIATVISTAISATIVLYWLTKESGDFKLSFKRLHMVYEHNSQIMTIGIPSAVQAAVFCVSNIFIQAAINSFGTATIAGCTIGLTYEYIAYFAMTGFTQAATTFISQNYAFGDAKRCKRITKITIVCGTIAASSIVIPVGIFREQFSSIFTNDTEVIMAASVRLLIILLPSFFCSLFDVTGGVLRGTGHSLAPAIVTLISTVVLRLIWLYTGFAQIKTPEALYSIYPFSWVLATILMWIVFAKIHPFKNLNSRD